MMTTCAKPAEAVCWNFTQDPSTSGKFCLRCGHGAECHLEGAHRAVAEWGGHDIDIAAYGSPEHCREKFKEVSDGADASAFNPFWRAREETAMQAMERQERERGSRAWLVRSHFTNIRPSIFPYVPLPEPCKHGSMGEHSWHMWDDEGNEVITYYTGSLTDCVPFRTEIKLEPSRSRERYQKVPIVYGQRLRSRMSGLGPDLEAWSWERELPRLKAMDPNSIEDLGEQPAEPDDLKCERPGCYIQWPHTCNRLA